MILSSWFTRSLVVVLISLHAAGCADLGHSYRQIDPAGALEDVRKHNGYYVLKALKAGSAKVVMNAHGAPFSASFDVSASDRVCEGFTRVGTATDLGRGIVYPWVADMTASLSLGAKAKGFVETEVTPGKRLQVRSSSYQHGRQFATCGPFALSFTPAVDRANLVQFLWAERSCTMTVVDATNPDQPLPIQVENLASCAAR